MVSEPAGQQTDRELYREDTGDPAGSHYEARVFVTADGRIGMNVGGTVLVRSIREWHTTGTSPVIPRRGPVAVLRRRVADRLVGLAARIDPDWWVTVRRIPPGSAAEVELARRVREAGQVDDV